MTTVHDTDKRIAIVHAFFNGNIDPFGQDDAQEKCKKGLTITARFWIPSGIIVIFNPISLYGPIE